MDTSVQFGSVFWCTLCAKPRETAKKAVRCCYWQQRKSASIIARTNSWTAKYRPSEVQVAIPVKRAAEKQRERVGALARSNAPHLRNLREQIAASRLRKQAERRARETRQALRRANKLAAIEGRRIARLRRLAARAPGAHLPMNPYEIRGRRIVRRFVASCKGVHNFRQILFDAYCGGVESTKLILALKYNAQIIASRSDYIVEYLLDSRLGLNPELTVEVDAWLRASPSKRRQIYLRDCVRVRAPPERQRYVVDWRAIKLRKRAERDLSLSKDIDEIVDNMFVPREARSKAGRFSVDRNNLYPVGYSREQTCETFATFCGVFRNFRERLAWSYVNLESDAEKCIKYFSHFNNKVRIIIPRLATSQAENEGAHGGGGVSQVESQNVIISTARDVSSDSIPRIGTWINATTEDTVGSFPELLERWNPVKQFVWKTSQLADAAVVELSLPHAVIKDAANADLISYVPFFSHQYWRGDMEIRIEANVNKFMVGQLQCAFYYGWDYDDNRDLRKNIECLSQCQHVIIDAGGSNSGDLIIPYKNQSACLPTRAANGMDPLYVGSLHIRVLSPLSVPSGSPTECSVIVYMRFMNSQFTGQISRKLTGLSQMESAAAFMLEYGAMKILDTVASDGNRDNPPAILPPTYVVPTASHSWSIGTGVAEPLHTLRLDGSGQTHHPSGISMDEHTTVRDVCRVFGLKKRITWSTSNRVGSNLATMIVNPTAVSGDVSRETLTRMRLAPVEVMSNLFAQWRGSIEYRFDMVASQFHTGRIMVAFIPNATSIADDAITFDVAKSSYNVVIDLHEQRSFTFVAPYVNSDPWNRRRYHMDGTDLDMSQHGKMAIFVMCALNCPSTVSNKIEIMMYMRAGLSYELAIPIQPSVGLGSNDRIVTWQWNTLSPLDGQIPVYLGTWDGYYGNNELVLRWGVLAGRVCDFPRAAHWNDPRHAKTKMYWKASEYIDTTLANGQRVNIIYYAVVGVDNTYVAWPCIDAAGAMALWSNYMAGREAWKSYIVRGSATSSASRQFHLERMQLAIEPEGERDNPEIVMDPSNSLVSTGAGRQLYGESFMRLKDIMRRYQLYGTAVIDAKTLDRSYAYLKFPVIPTGLKLDIGTNDLPNRTANKCREGIIPIILSGYRYYRGSIRFRIVMPRAVDGALWVQHRPDCWNGEAKITDATGGDDELAMLAHGYAMYIQFALVNGILEFEVPFYQTGVFGLLGPVARDCAKPYNNNGTIVVGGFGMSLMKSANVQVYYSLGDDFAFNTFQGFMPMVDAAPIALVDNVYTSSKTSTSSSEFEMVRRADSQMMGWLGGKVAKAAKKKAKEHADEFVAKAKASLDEAIGQAQHIKEGVDKELIVDVVSQAAHIVNNPSAKTVAIAIVTFLAKLGLRLSEYMQVAVDFVKHLFAKFGVKGNEEPSPTTPGKPPPVPQRAHRRAQSQAGPEREEDDTTFQWLSALATAISVALGLKKCGNIKDAPLKTEWMLKLGTQSMQGGNTLLRFLKNHVKVIESIKNWFACQFCPTFRIKNMFKTESPKIKMWLDEALLLCDVDLRRPDFVSESFLDRLTCCELIGREILTSFAVMERGGAVHVSAHIERYYERIRKILRDQIAMGKSPYLRIKPVHIQLFGQAGVGKSEFLRELSKYMLQQMDIDVSENPNHICYVDSSNKYWTQCDGKQPVVVLDDVWAVTTPNVLEAQLTAYFTLYGTTVFSPPMAAVEDKRMRYAPSLMLSTTNKPQIVIQDVDVTALKRRRDLLIEVEAAPLDPEGHPSCPHCQGSSLCLAGREELEDFHHIRFYKHDIFGKSGGEEDRRSTAMTWPQLKMVLKNEAMAIYNQNKRAYLADVKKFVFKDIELDDEDIPTLEKRILARKRDIERLHCDRYTHVSEYIPRCKDYIKTCLSNDKFGFKKYWDKFTTRSAEPEMSDEENSMLTDVGNRSDMPLSYWRDFIEGSPELATTLYKCAATSTSFDATSFDLRVLRAYAPFCEHNEDTFLESTYSDGAFQFDDGCIAEEVRCEEACCLDNEYTKKLFLNQWLNTTSKRRHFKYQTPGALPSFAYRAGANGNAIISTIKNKIQGAFEKISNGSDLFWAAWRKIKTALKWISSVIERYWWIIGPVVGFIGYMMFFNDEPGGLPVIAAANACTAYGAAINMHDYLNRDNPSMILSEANYYAADNPRVARTRVVKPVATPQAGAQQADVAESIIRSNSAYITIEYLDEAGCMRRNKFMGLILYERKILLQRHYVESIQNAPRDAVVRFRYVENTGRMVNGEIGMEINFLNCQMEYFHYEEGKRDSNFVIVTLPKHINCHKSLVKFIAPANTHCYVGRRILFVRPGSSSHMLEMNVGPGITINGLENNRYSDDIELDRTYEYRMSSPGYCGSIIMDPSLQHPIIGMHVAGMSGTGTGIAEILTQEAFMTKPNSESPIVDICDIDVDSIDLSKINLSSQLYLKGVVDNRMASNQSSETAFCKSLAVGEIFPLNSEPMPLSANDPRMGGQDPLAMACNCHGLLSREFDPEDLDVVQEHYQQKVLIEAKPVRTQVGVLSYQEAIIGVPQIPEFSPLEWNSSEGFPLCKLRPANVRGKKWLFGLESQNDGSLKLTGMHPELARLLGEQEQCRRNGIKPTTVYTDCLKDEIRTYDKSRTPGKTRVISTCPVQYLIAFKRYYGDFIAAFKRARLDVESGIGINPDSAEWALLARRLQQVGPKIVAGDYSKFGYTLNSEVLARTFKIANAWYAKYSTSETLERDQLVRAVIAEEGINVTRLARNLVYEAPCGLASGFPTTDISNTMVNNLYVRLAWRGITGGSMRDFDKHTRLVTYGDDLIMNVSDEFAERFNAETMQHYFALHDIKFTDIDKSGSIIKYRDLKTAPFLKRNFVKHPTRPAMYLASIDAESIANCLNWVRKKDEPIPAYVTNCRAALNLMYSHGPEAYLSLYRDIQRILATYDVNFVEDTWTEKDNKIYGADNVV